VLVGSDNKPVGLINDGDPVIFFNYRSDRARQIANELSDRLPHSQIITFVPYGSTEDRLKKDNVIAAFKPEPIQDGLANFLSKNNIHQLHVAESEKYAHVTYFFNSGVETANEFEDRIVIPSPKVKTYDLKPEMSAKEITKTVIKGLNGDHYQFIVVNYANADMVGHTGNLKASINALECLDACFGQVVQAAEENNWYTIITADHGNVEEMVDPITGEINPEHTRNPVPFVIIPPHDQQTGNLIKTGTLADVAPTILHIMGIKKPNVMTGHNLLADP
jgi:2,3-bisphosphoglycerate-independent phosphoglycerate mutase